MPEGFSWQELGIDASRVEVVNDAPLPERGELVVYWCQMNHRAERNPALDAAVRLANHLHVPLVCYQALRPDYPHASDRLHAFILQGHVDLRDGLEARGIAHWLELPRNPREHVGRIAELSRRAKAIVTDLFPTFIVPGHLRAAGRVSRVPVFAVDGSCVVPMKRIPDLQVAARTLRPKIRKLWPEYRTVPEETALRRRSIGARAPAPDFAIERKPEDRLRRLGEFAIDHSVPPVRDAEGGRAAALERLGHFVTRHLSRFAEARNAPGEPGSSGLSPYLHFGQLSSHEAVDAAIAHLGEEHPGTQAFFEQIVVRRELGFNYCWHRPPPAQLAFSSLPAWAQATLDAHRKDRRFVLYDDGALERAETDDELWNAAQRELVTRGSIHNYLRMLWAKKLLEWSPTPEDALRRIAWLNDKYALDGRDPASVANFMWTLGLHDRPFQERPILGKVRPMSSERTYKKFDLTPYLERFAAQN